MTPGPDFSTYCLGIVLGDDRPDNGRRPGKPPQDEFLQQATREYILGEKPPQSGVLDSAHIGPQGLVIAQGGGESQPRRSTRLMLLKKTVVCRLPFPRICALIPLT